MTNNKNNNFKVLDATNVLPSQKRDMQQGIKEFKELLPEMIELSKLKAYYSKERMNHLLDEGFTEYQALEIVKAGSTVTGDE